MTSSDEVNITITLTQVIPLQTVVAVFLSALNIFLAITGSLGNALILNVLPKTSLHSPTKLLFGNLAVTDLCVGLISQPLFVTIRLSAVIKMDLDIQYYLMNIANAFDFILCGVSILTLSAISVDRLLALLLGIRYRAIVNLRHTRALLSCFWLSGISGVLLSLFTSFSVASIVGVIFVIISTVISIFCYTKIFMTLRQNETQVQNLGQQRRMGMSPNIGRYKKTVWSIAPHFFLQVISCPVQSSSGGALVSLEASTTPESLVIVWPVQCDPRTTEITAYSVLINGQPFGEQVSMRNNCCFLLSWDKIKRGSHFLCHARCLTHFRVRTMILRISFSFKTVCYVKSHVHCYLTTGSYISHVLVCHETTLKPPRSPLPQNNMILRTN